MSGERLDLHPHDQYSPSLPPLEAWKDPEAWLDLKTGLPKKGIEKLQLIPGETLDDRGFVKIDELVDYVMRTLFRDDYNWRFDPTNFDSRFDNHHFYYNAAEYEPGVNNGILVPRQFRETPTNIGRMRRPVHNTFHAFVQKPRMPDVEAMHEYNMSYQLAHAAFKRLYLAAHETVNVMGSFSSRRQSIASGAVTPKDEYDSFAEEFLRTNFNRNFTRYSGEVERFRDTQGKEIVYKEHEAIKVTRPIVVVRKMGAIVNRKAVVVRLDQRAA